MPFLTMATSRGGAESFDQLLVVLKLFLSTAQQCGLQFHESDMRLAEKTLLLRGLRCRPRKLCTVVTIFIGSGQNIFCWN